jgi:DNA repair exonuclease SbcCD ATPase subunit
MYLTKVTLKNFGPHKDFSCELRSGLIGVVGYNGSGKSTLINAIYACLTNDFSRFEKRKAGVINDLAGEEAACYVEVAGRQEGTNFVLRRNIKPSSSRLTLSSGTKEEVYRKQGDIEQRLIKDLGLTRKIVDSYVFVPQWGMFDFLSQTPAKRAEVFSYLCKTEQAESINKICGRFLSCSLFSSSVVDNREEIKSQIAELEQSIEEVQSELSLDLVSVLSQAEEDKLTKRIKDFELLEERGAKIALWVSCITDSRNSLKRFAERAALLIEKRKAHMPSVLTLKWLPRTKQAIKSYESWLAAESAIEMLDERIAIIQANKPVFTPPLEQLPLCPTCNQKIGHAQAVGIQEDLHKERVAEWESNIATREVELSRLKDKLPAVQVTDEDYKLCLERMAAHETSSRIVTQVEQELLSLRDQGQLVKKRLSADKARRSSAVAALAEHRLLDYNEDSAAEDNLKLKHSRMKKEKCTFNQGQLNSKREALLNFETVLQNLDVKLKSEKENVKTSDIVKEVKDLFHWSSLPRLVSLANLSAIVQEVNKTLVNFESPFWVEADSELNFLVHFPGSPARSAGSLSGGQKVVLAICFRSAVNKIFGNEIGMMFLDEPTAGLDSDNLNNFKIMLEKMSMAIEGGFQLFVITHEESLSSSFTQIIDLCSHE